MQKKTGHLQKDSDIMNGFTEVEGLVLIRENKPGNRKLRFSETREVKLLSL